MKLIIIVNNLTDTFEACIPSRDLSTDEILALHELVGHGEHRTVHIAEAGDRPICFLDIVEVMKGIITPSLQEVPHAPVNDPGKVSNLRGLATKVSFYSAKTKEDRWEDQEKSDYRTESLQEDFRNRLYNK